MARPVKFLCLLLVLTLRSGPVWADTAARPGHKILVLFKQRDKYHEATVSYLTGFLKSLGYSWDARDIESLLPQHPDMSGYWGIMTCFETSEMVNADQYATWMAQQVQDGKRILVIGSYGAYQGLIPKAGGKFVEWNESTATINTFFWPFGLEFYFAFTDKSSLLQYTHTDKRYGEYQAALPAKITYYQYFKSVNPQNKVYVEITRKDILDGHSALVVQTPHGGMILESLGYYWDPKVKKLLQRVDLKGFMHDAFEAPCPPVQTYDIKTHEQLVAENPLPSRTPPQDDRRVLPGEVRRRVLILYKKDESPTLEHNSFRNRAELVLNYLGVLCDYWPVDAGLPTDAYMQPYLGIITWHDTPEMKHAAAYGAWLARQIAQGRKVVILDSFGAEFDADTQEETGWGPRIYEQLGITYKPLLPLRVEDPPEVKISDPDMIGFEHPIPPGYITWNDQIRSKLPNNKVWLAYTDPQRGETDLVVTTPYGGIALENSPFYFPPRDTGHLDLVRRALRGEIQPELAEEPTIGQWIVNPYRFFAEALGIQKLPAPDYTTLNGSRIFYSHIDGDALDSISLIDKAHFAGSYILEDNLKTHPLVPVTVSVISKPVETYGNQFYHPLIELGRALMALPNVEPASHTTTHPFDLVGGDPYVVNPGQYPYKIGYRPQDFVKEIWASKLWIEKYLCPPGKTCQVLLWPGATNPNVTALDVVWRAGMFNLNGGDPIFDSKHPSIASLCPISTPGGTGAEDPRTPYRQFHSSAQNDYLYTLFLTGDWAGERNVIDHFKHTGSPYRIEPMNVYYHYYSGIKTISLDALNYVFDTVMSWHPALCFASDYCRIAEDYVRTRVGQDAGGWWVENSGDLRTVRFPGTVDIDVAGSQGVLGYLHDLGQTYVHLDGSPRRYIVLSNQPPQVPYLRQCTLFVDGCDRSDKRVS